MAEETEGGATIWLEQKQVPFSYQFPLKAASHDSAFEFF